MRYSFVFVLILAACASPSKKSEPKGPSTKEVVAMQTTQTGAEGEDIKIDKLMESARITPYPKKGAVQGFLFEEIKPKSEWTRAGFKKGDIVIRVAEQPIASRDDLMTLFYAVGSRASFEVEVLREDGKRKPRKNVIFSLLH